MYSKAKTYSSLCLSYSSEENWRRETWKVPQACSMMPLDSTIIWEGFDYLLLPRIAKSESLFIRRRWVNGTSPFQDLLTLDLSAGCFEWTELHERVSKKVYWVQRLLLSSMDFCRRTEWSIWRLDWIVSWSVFYLDNEFALLPLQSVCWSSIIFMDGADSWIKVFGWSLETGYFLRDAKIGFPCVHFWTES